MAERLLNPQQELFLASYTDPKSATFGNALQSALKAGYTQDYADNIMALLPDWLSENIGDMKMVKKAEKNLNAILEMDMDDPSKAKLVQDTSKFVVERLNKKKYSQRQELSDPDGNAIPLQTINITPITTNGTKEI